MQLKKNLHVSFNYLTLKEWKQYIRRNGWPTIEVLLLCVMENLNMGTYSKNTVQVLKAIGFTWSPKLNII